MSTDTFVQGLSGHEIVNDLCYQIEQQLKRDCNLTADCCYEGGYFAKVKIEMKMHGIDTVVGETEISIGKPSELPGTTVEETVEVPVDTRLDMVRKRSEQPIPTLALENGEPVIKQRRYQKAVPHNVPSTGGATGDQLETE